VTVDYKESTYALIYNNTPIPVSVTHVIPLIYSTVPRSELLSTNCSISSAKYGHYLIRYYLLFAATLALLSVCYESSINAKIKQLELWAHKEASAVDAMPYNLGITNVTGSECLNM
jgi:hypothetical protein